MRLSKKAKENMLMYQNLPKLSAEAKDQNRKDRKCAAKTRYIFELPSRTANPKKNTAARRPRGKLAVYIPFVLHDPRIMKNSLTGKRTVFAGYCGFNNTNKAQKIINDALIMRAHQARRDGGYFHINPQADHGKNRKHAD